MQIRGRSGRNQRYVITLEQDPTNLVAGTLFGGYLYGVPQDQIHKLVKSLPSIIITGPLGSYQNLSLHALVSIVVEPDADACLVLQVPEYKALFDTK